LLRQLAAQGVKELVADFLPTTKNEPTKNFLPDQGFEKGPDGRYQWNLGMTPPRPESDFQTTVALKM
jgi:hypothetical protein